MNEYEKEGKQALMEKMSWGREREGEERRREATGWRRESQPGQSPGTASVVVLWTVVQVKVGDGQEMGSPNRSSW
jgi:hypothetical protein